jgi:hypothetical protein
LFRVGLMCEGDAALFFRQFVNRVGRPGHPFRACRGAAPASAAAVDAPPDVRIAVAGCR